MPLVRYIGPHVDGVTVKHGHGGVEARPGQPVEVPDDLASALLAQPTNWEAVPSSSKKEKVSDE